METICSILLENDPDFFKTLDLCNQSSCDWIEIRLDSYYPKQSLIQTNQLIKQCSRISEKPILWTMRTDQKDQPVSADQYKYLIKLLNREADYFDLEINRIEQIDFDLDFGKVFLSYHNYKSVPDPDHLKTLCESMKGLNPKVIKLAVMADNPAQMIDFLRFMKAFDCDSEKIALVMGELGLISRLVPEASGSSYTFVCLENPTAPGQVSIQEYESFQSLLKGNS